MGMLSPAIKVEVNNIMLTDFNSTPKQFNEKRIVFVTNNTETIGYSHVKSKVGPLPHTIQRSQFKIEHKLTIIAKTTKLLKENIRVNLWALGLSHVFLDMTSKA